MLGKRSRRNLNFPPLWEKQNRYGIRKKTIGTVSVLLGSFFLVNSGSFVKADNISDATSNQVVNKETSSPDVTSRQDTTVVLANKANTANTANTDATSSNSQATAGNANTTNETTTTTNNPGQSDTTSVNNKTAQPTTTQVEQPTSTNTPASSTVRAKQAVANQAEIIDENEASSNVTLNHGDSGNRAISVIVAANRDDEFTVEVPYIFTGTTDRSLDGKYDVTSSVTKVTDPGFATNKNFQDTTFTYHIKQKSSTTFNVTLNPTISDWGFFAEGTKFYVILKKNGVEVGRLTYTIGEKAQFTNATPLFDDNQKSPLSVNEKYPIAIALNNNGVKDGNQFSGTINLDVPAGFVVDANNFGLVAGQNIGDDNKTFYTLVNNPEYLKVEQAGAGSPVTITFNNLDQSLLNGNEIVLFGSYQNNLAAENNNFQATVTYHVTNKNNDHNATDKDLVFTGDVKHVGLAVTGQKAPDLEASYTVDEKNNIFVDKVNNGKHDTDNPYLDYQQERAIQVFNKGNEEQTNVKVHFIVEEGTVFVKRNGQYGINIQTNQKNRIASVMVTLANGQKVQLGVNQGDTSTFVTFPAGSGINEDGSNITAIDFVFDNIIAGTKVLATYNSNGILNKKDGDHADYQLMFNSDQVSDTVDVKQELTVKNPASKSIFFTGGVFGFKDGAYQPTDTVNNGNKAEIRYVLQNATAPTNDSSSYIIVIPKGFDIDKNDIHITQVSQWVGGAPDDLLKNKLATLTDLGYIGKNGEHVFRIDLTFTPSYGRPVWVGGATPQSTMTITANKNQLPGRYQYKNPGEVKGNDVVGYWADRSEAIKNNPKLKDEKGQELLYKVDDVNHASDQAKDFTFKNGDQYKLISMIYGLPGANNGLNYILTSPSTYGKDNRIKGDLNVDYSSEDPEDTPATNNYDTAHKKDGYTGDLVLINYLNDKGTSKYSYNVIDLPDLDSGDLITMHLTGKGTDKVEIDNSGNGTLKFSTKHFTGKVVTVDDLKDFVTADQVKDWSQIKAVMLQSDVMKPYALAKAELGYIITGMQDGVSLANLKIREVFSGNLTSSTGISEMPYNDNESSLKLSVQRYVDVTTKWVDDDNNSNPLKQDNVDFIKSGDPYLTNALDANDVPAHILFKNVEGEPTGITAGKDVTVVYHYVHEKKEIESQDKLHVTRTIHVTYPGTRLQGGQSEATIQQDVPFTVYWLTDLYTGQQLSARIVADAPVDTDHPGTGSWAEYTPVHIPGYTIKVDDNAGTKVPGVQVGPNDKDVTVEVTYVPVPQQIKFNVYDDTTKTQLLTDDEIKELEKQGILVTIPGVSDQVVIKGQVSDKLAALKSYYLAKGYKFVSDDLDQLADRYDNTDNATNNVAITDPNDDQVPQVVTLHIAHDIALDKQVKSVTRTINYYDENEHQLISDVHHPGITITEPGTKTQTVNFNRYAVYDKVTHELLGYASSDQVNGNALITTDGYIHDTDPNSVAGYVADGNFAEVDNYDLSKYGYTGPTDEQHQKMAQVASAAADVNKAQTIVNVYYQHATTNTENDKTITRTINVHKPTGQTEQVLQNADFHVVSVIDKVTGATVSTTVTTPDGKTDTWAQYSPMTIPGYGIQVEDTTDQNNKFALDSINQKTVAITDHNVVIDVNYLAQAQNVTVKYVDDDEGGKQVGTTTTLNGATDTTDTISVKVPENYVYNNRIDLDGKQVASNMAYTYTFQPGTHEVVIHLGHKIETSQETQSIKASQTVTYQGAGQQTPKPNVTSKDIDFTRTVKTDMVTNEKTYSAWTGNDYTFNKIISPNVRGYQPDMGVVGGAQVTLSELNSASPEQMAEYLKNGINFDYVVTYHANQQTVKVVYLDEDNNNEIVRYGNDINSSFGENVTVVPSLIANEEGKYYLKSTDPINHVVSDKDEDNVITIYLKHKHVQNTETSAPTRTINVHMPDGKVETTVQQLNFSRSVDTDLVTNAKTYSNWTITDEETNADQANSSWNAFTAPELTGYQADTKAVQSKVIAHDTPNEIVDIHYQAEDRTVNVKYVDDDKLDADGNPTELPELTGTLTGKYDEYTTITPTIPENYQFKKVDNNPNLTQADQGYSYHFLVDGDTVVIHLGHEHMDVERSQTATQTIHYVDQDGNTIHPDQSQTLTFKQKGDKDLVTGEIVWDPAYQETLNFDKVASPAISGYQNPNPALVPGSGLTLNNDNFTADHNSEVTVVYEKVTEPATQTPGDNQPAEPNKDGNLTPDAPAATGKNTNNTARETENKDRKLPQTGDNEDDFAYAGFFSMILGLLGLGFLKKRD
ncbi:YSIRK-type signal peptide-containing protein [Ligilactobacillus saerimneri]|uniref:mucin-binding protein n=1 Tax=Ligilactobacillus saerimneri TaxID=228229 RepID=UPI0030D03C4D